MCLLNMQPQCSGGLRNKFGKLGMNAEGSVAQTQKWEEDQKQTKHALLLHRMLFLFR